MKNLGELERGVMDVLWDNNGEFPVRDIVAKIQQKREIAYTTVATILDRLYEKKLVSRRKMKNNYLYKATLLKEAYIQSVSASFINSLFGSFGEGAIPNFIRGINKLPKAKRIKLLQLLEKYGK